MIEEKQASAPYVALSGGGLMMIIAAQLGERPSIVHWGPQPQNVDPSQLALLSRRQAVHGGPAIDVRATLSNEMGIGISGPTGLSVHRSGKDWATDLRVAEVELDGGYGAVIRCEDRNTQIGAEYHLAIDPVSGVLIASTQITNLGQSDLSVEWCASLCIPLDESVDHLTGFTGRWAGEFATETIPLFQGSYVRENKAGRTSHDSFPGLLAAAKATGEDCGTAISFHLGWSGNHRLRVDRHADGRAYVQMGEMLFPGEITLAPGEGYASPDLAATWSNSGFTGAAQNMHRYCRDALLDARTRNRSRPVHFNTWEALYFDLSEDRVLELAQMASEVGAERFILDDGWFGGRRHDAAGLGDWFVSPDVFPDGLHKVVSRVRELGMEFGLWFEPEMVNPDSDLYLAHPDWVLGAEGAEQIPFRNQFTLDLTKPPVSDYLFTRISALVDEYAIDYIKWDMNRETFHPGSDGRAAMHRQTRAVYRLIKKLRDKHGALEIESCSSGGGRADFGILRHTDRIWTSDNNDPHERQNIQRGASHFFPLRVMGSHVGPRTCHITKRTFTMEFRAATAIFGHMGMELDLALETPEDRAVLAAATALYKQHRQLLHDGAFYRIATPEYLNMVGSVAADQSEAIYSCAQLASHTSTLPPRIRFAGLDPARSYRLKCIWPRRNISVTSPSIMEAANLLDEGSIFSGGALIEHGMQLPMLYPDSCLIFHLQAQT